MGSIISKKRNILDEIVERQEDLEKLEKLKQKVIRKPRMELILLLEVVLTRSLQEDDTSYILSLTDPIFIQDIIFKVKKDCVILFSELLDRIVDGTYEGDKNLKKLITDAIFLHSIPLPNNGYERLRELGFSHTSIYIISHHTHSNIPVPEDDLDIGKIIDVLSKQESMDEVQSRRFRAFISLHIEKIRNDFEIIMNGRMLSPNQLIRIIEKLDFVDLFIAKSVARYFNNWIECEKVRRDISDFMDTHEAEQWVRCFRSFLEGENKTTFEKELLSTSSPDNRSLIDQMILKFNIQD